MNTKESVLKILYNSSEAVSGEAIAKELGISRNSVWKAVNQLKKDGYTIHSVPNKGYLLIQEDILDECSIQKYLNKKARLYIYKKESSSNTVAKELCQRGEGEGSVVIVESQTNGRGRMGRSFISDGKNGLYMSIILRPKIQADKCVNITVMTAVSVLEAVEEVTGVPCQIKWINDIYINDKKCCGILTEASTDLESGSLHYAIVGIGINLCQPKGGFPQEIKDIACGIYEGEEYPKGTKAKLCAKIIDVFFKYYEEYNGNEENNYIKKYKEKSNILGKSVDVYVGGSVVSGTAIDIDNSASLIVKDTQGKIHSFNSGEARVRAQGAKLS